MGTFSSYCNYYFEGGGKGGGLKADSGCGDLFARQGQGVVAKLWFVVSFPLNALMSLTMFHQPELYLVTIVSAMAWLALLAYMLDWSASRVGCYLHIDDELIGEECC